MHTKKIKVYGRIKPTSSCFSIKNYEIGQENNGEKLVIGHFQSFPLVQSYRFQKVFDQKNHSQEDVFNIVAKPVLEKFLIGCNGTIFAYGQTGTGKTYTMTGDFSKCEDRGIIPRTLEYIFECAADNTIISISYFEIYNERGYDLITTESEEGLIDFQNVTVLEDAHGNLHFRNLSSHNVTTAGEALDLLVRGDENRMVAETMSNLRSSRSHTIFLILLETYDSKSKTYVRSTLHLVDLAGSERISKDKAGAAKLWETRYINLSLHYLEQVLVALGEPGRAHIPYRNSLMTTVLKNSLGGNCCTVMIATISLESKDVAESLQTCRFSQRVSLIKNYNEINKVIDAEKQLKMLRKENSALKIELSVLRANKLLDNSADDLLEEEKQECFEKVKNFIEHPQAKMDVLDLRQVQYCFLLLREEIDRLKSENSTDKKFEDLYDLKSQAIEERERKTLSLKKSENIFIETEKHTDSVKGSRENMLRKRRVLDIPKINVIYKKYKSKESLINDSKSMKSQSQTISRHPDSTISSHTANKPTDISRSKFSQTSLEHLNSGVQEKLAPVQSQINGLKGKLDLENSGALENHIEGKSENFQNASTSSITAQREKFEDQLDSTNCTLYKAGNTSRFYTYNFEVELNKGEELTGNAHDCNRKGFYTSETYDTENKQENSGKFFNYNRESQFSESDVPLTGDKEIDEEILKFYKARFEKFKSEDKNIENIWSRPIENSLLYTYEN